MKSIVLLSIALVSVALIACENSATKVEQGIPPAVGDVHNDFLDRLFQRISAHASDQLTPSDKVEIAYRTAKEIYEEHGLNPMTREEVAAVLDRGYQMALQDPVELVKQALPADQYEWWDRFASQATVENAHSVYAKTCEIHGEPRPGTMLKDLVDISLSSAEFWLEKRGGQEPRITNPYVPQIHYSWKRRLLRFGVSIVADGLSGAAAGAGTGGNLVVAGVVGGLCSYAVNDMLFGDGP